MSSVLKFGIAVSVAAVLGVAFVLLGGTFFVRTTTAVAQTVASSTARIASTTRTATQPEKPAVVHKALPVAVKAIYMSQCGASSAALRKSVLAVADTTEVNSIVLDLKDYTGTLSFPSSSALPNGKGCTISDFKALVEDMHKRDIYVIGRMTVFQDPLYTKTYPQWAVKRKSDGEVWKDRKGLAFVDVGAEPFWKYIATISRDAVDLGVDEINFDYIRYPSDGNMKDIKFTHSTGTKQEQLEKFFAYLQKEVKAPTVSGYVPYISADTFGMTSTNYDDLSIGQVLERALAHFDFVAPMVYPSHYPPGFNGYADPNKNVYGVIKYSMDRAVERAKSTTTPIAVMGYARVGTSTPARYEKPSMPATKLRTWIQDFDYGGDYGPTEVRAQFQATYDAGLTSWMIWSPSNRYTKAALYPEGQ
jgi:hypothetical protein